MILIYNDDGVSNNCLNALLDFITTNFSKLPCKLTNSENIIADLHHACLLIIPGGRDLAYCSKLNGLKNQKIKQFIAEGGAYLGICAGAYYASSAIHFSGEGYQINGQRELSLFSGRAIGSIPELTNGIYFNDNTTSKAIAVLNNQSSYYYHGGCYFSDIKHGMECINYQEINKPAIVYGHYYNGKYLLSGVHFEITKQRYKKFTLINEHHDSLHEQMILNALPEKDSKWIIAMINRLLD